jgi:phospho-N-acetylmuramoyl-pentapeptide-transferase
VKTIVFAGGLALLGTLLGTRMAIRVLVKKGYGQLIRDDGPTSHHVKRGTPTMGGLVIIAAVLTAYIGSHVLTWTAPSASAVLILFLFTGLGAVGFLDDWLKIRNHRSLGLRSKAKIAGQSLVAIVFALLSLQFPDERGITPASEFVSFLRDIDFLQLPTFLVVIWVILLIAAASNGVNLTDGLDGLATGACTMTDSAMRTKRPPTSTSSSSVRLVMARPASAPPSASEPVSPMKILAGDAFHHRNPKQAPMIAAATTARSSGSRAS